MPTADDSQNSHAFSFKPLREATSDIERSEEIRKRMDAAIDFAVDSLLKAAINMEAFNNDNVEEDKAFLALLKDVKYEHMSTPNFAKIELKIDILAEDFKTAVYKQIPKLNVMDIHEFVAQSSEGSLPDGWYRIHTDHTDNVILIKNEKVEETHLYQPTFNEKNERV